jgi:hypothetical protein
MSVTVRQHLAWKARGHFSQQSMVSSVTGAFSSSPKLASGVCEYGERSESSLYLVVVAAVVVASPALTSSSLK